MSATRPYLLALLALCGLAISASAETKLINPISRSFRSQTPRVVPVSAWLQEGETPAAEAEPAPPTEEPAIPDVTAEEPAIPDAAAEAAEESVIVDAADDAAEEPVIPDVAADEAEDAAPADEAVETDEAREDSLGSASDLDIPEVLDMVEAPEMLDEFPDKGDDVKDDCGNPCCCDGSCCRRGGRRWARLGGADKPWSLPQPRVLQHLGIKVGGWVQGGMTTNNNSPTDNFNSLVALNDRDGEFQFNQIWVHLVKPVDQEGCSWQAGGRVDLMWGTDWRYGRFFGLEERINNDSQLYGWVFPQMYAELGGHNLSVKIGHMAGPLGYEIVPSVANFFYSHSTAMDYFEPQLVTGVWADYKLNDNWNVQGGVHRGWFMFEDLDSNWDVMGGIQWTSCDKRTSVRYAFSSGRNHGLWGDNWLATSLVLKHKFNDKWEYVLQHDLGTINNINPAGMFGAGVVGDEEWYGLNQYLFYNINKKLKAGVRVEWMRDDDGGKLAGVGNTPPGTIRGWSGGPGYAGNFYEITAGLNWSPHPNVRLRPEVRYDWYDGAPSPFPGGVLPFDDGLGDDQFTAAFDVLVTF